MDINTAISQTQFSQTFKIRQPRFWVSVAFILPDEVSTNLPAVESLKCQGQYLIGFNFQPQRNEYFPYEGHIWRVKHAPLQFPTRYKSRSSNPKYPPYMMVEYIDSYTDELEMMTKLLDRLTNI